MMLIDAPHQSDVPIPFYKLAKSSVHLSQSLSNLWCPIFMSIAIGHQSTSTAPLTLPEKMNAPLRTSHADILSVRCGTWPRIDSTDVSMPKNTRSHRRTKKRSFLEKANGEARNRKGKVVAYKRVDEMVKSDLLMLTNLRITKITVAKGDWLGSRKRDYPEEALMLNGALEKGYKLLQWDGM